MCQTMSCDNSLVMDALKESGTTTDLMELMTCLDVSNCVVKLLDYSRSGASKPGLDPENDLLYIVQELGGVSLEDKLADRDMCDTFTARGSQRIDTTEIKDMFWSLVCITWGLHVCGYVHMDIKPKNIVLFPACDGKPAHWKLIDLDGAIAIEEKIPVNECCFTLVYMPPELAEATCKDKPAKSPKSKKSKSSENVTVSRLMDVWSVAMCVLHAIFATPVLEPWMLEWREETGDDTKFLKWLAKHDSDPIIDGDMKTYISGMDGQMCALLEGMLKKDPKHRFCIARCLADSVFQEHRNQLLHHYGNFLSLDEKTLGDMEDSRRKSQKHKSKSCEVM